MVHFVGASDIGLQRARLRQSSVLLLNYPLGLGMFL